MVENRSLTNNEIGLLAGLIIDEPDHYTVLGVDRNASDDEIRNAYCIAVEYFHPLKSRELTEADSVMHWKLSSAFVRIEEAFAILSSRSRRKVYDDNLNSETLSRMQQQPSAPTSSPVSATNDAGPATDQSQRVATPDDSLTARRESPTITHERRRVPRVTLSVPLRVTFERQWQELTQTEDVSPLGIKFRLSRRVEPGSQLRLEMPLPRYLRTHSYDEELYVVSAFAIQVSQNNRKWQVVAEFI